MNATGPPPVNTTSSLSFEVTLDLSADPLNGIANNYLDTLHSDYAFIITVAPEHRSMTIPNGTDTLGRWDFGLYPNPADDMLNLLLPDDAPTDIAIYDQTGRKVHSWASVIGPLITLPVGELARGACTMRVADGLHRKVKQLIVR